MEEAGLYRIRNAPGPRGVSAECGSLRHRTCNAGQLEWPYLSTLEMLVEKIQRALPCELSGGLIIAGCRVVMEAVVRAFIHVHSVSDVIGFQRFFVSGPSVIDTLIERRVMNQKGRLNFGDIRGWL